jgi:predicted dehydrogenase
VEGLRELGFNAVASLTDLEESQVSASVVCTETRRHLMDASELLPFGDVLVEKPLSHSAAGLSDLEDRAGGLGRKIFVAFHLRFDPSLQLFKELLGDLGQVFSVRIECTSYLPDWRPERDYLESYSARASDGGVLRDLSHELDYAVWLFGRPESVSCQLGNTGSLGIAADESADLMWVTTGGASVSIRLDYLARFPTRSIKANGEKGALSYDAISGRVELEVLGRPVETFDLDDDRDDIMARQLAAFIGPDSEGSPLATFEEGAFITTLSDAARESASTGRAIQITHWREESS